MSFSDNSSNSNWKQGKTMKIKKTIKQEAHSPLNKTKYSQKFCEKWLNLFNPWLARCDDDQNKPFCRACQCRLDCNRCHLQRHERTTKHQRNLGILISKGEGAARQNLSVRQERSKYYQQRKKLNSSMASSQEMSDHALEDDVDDPDVADETEFQFVHTESSQSDHYNEGNAGKQEIISNNHHSYPTGQSTPKSKTQSRLPASNAQKKFSSHKQNGTQLLLQIQKDKNDLMESFKQLMGGQLPSSPPKDKHPVDLFFESVSATVKALSPKLIAETKMRVSQLICELELRSLNERLIDSSDVGNGATVVVSSGPNNTYVAGGSNAQIESDGQHYEALS